MRETDFAAIEAQHFFEISSELRALRRKSQPGGALQFKLLDELEAIAAHTKQPRLAARCRAILEGDRPAGSRD